MQRTEAKEWFKETQRSQSRLNKRKSKDEKLHKGMNIKKIKEWIEYL